MAVIPKCSKCGRYSQSVLAECVPGHLGCEDPVCPVLASTKEIVKIDTVPAGFKLTDPYVVFDKPFEEFISGEKLWIGDFIEVKDGQAYRSDILTATHALFSPNAEIGTKVLCYPLDKPK